MLQRTIIIAFILFAAVFFAAAQAGRTMNADGTTDTYNRIESYGYGVEVPDCGHPVKHITQVFDKELNRYVFAFTLHAKSDDDRCGAKDRQRAEIKTFGPSPESMKGFRGMTHTYKWKFKLDKNFQPAPSFCHIHQIKADSGPGAGAPIVTLTPRVKNKNEEVLQLNQVSSDNKSTILAEVPLADFKGVWVEVTETARYDRQGTLEMEIRRVSDGKVLLRGGSNNADMWRDGARFNRPKYGIYRSLRNPSYLRDETVLFADIEFIVGAEQKAGSKTAIKSEKIFNVRDFGVKGDGKTLDSPAIQKAIDACTQAGGGTVVIPPGTFLSGTIVLKDNVRMYLDKNALLLGSTDINDYVNPDPFTEGVGADVGWALLFAGDAKNVSVEGEGEIDGQGSAIKARQTAEETHPESKLWGRRPFLLRVLRCDGVKVQGVTMKYAGAWTSHYAQSKNIEIGGLKIISHGVAHNDGINIDGCQHVRISNCDIDSGDDALCFKATSAKAPCRDITVSNMRLKSNHAGIKMGTESMSAFEDIRISKCHIYDTRNGGIKLMTVDGARLRNIEITDITMENVRTPMLFRLGSRLNVFRKKEDVRQSTGVFEHVHIRNVKAKSDAETQLTHATGILITGVPGHYINDLTLENIEIELPGGGTLEESRRTVQEAVNQYPEIKTFGPYVPAYGVWARHVKNLRLNNVSFRTTNPDLRPAFICQDGEHIIVNNFGAEAAPGSESVIRLDSVRGAYITAPNIKGSSDALLQLKGTMNREIYLDGKQTTQVNKTVSVTDGANVSVVEQRPLPDAANTAVIGAHLSYAPGKTPKSWAIAAAQSTMARWPDYSKAYWNSWTYVNAYMACAFERLYRDTGDTTYMGYIKRYVDGFIDDEGNFRAVRNNKGVTRMPSYCNNLDGMMPGNTVVMLYEHYKDPRYKKAAETIRKCFDNYPRNSDGGFWHGNGMHGQMWIDGVFMGQMFLLRYGKSIGDSQYAYDEAARQITAYAKRGEQGNSGLYVHGVYEPGHGSRVCTWADPVTGKSSEVWSEGLGWYALVLVEALETIPQTHPEYDEIKDIYIRMAVGLKKAQDPKTGGWFQVVDKPDRPDNWIDTSGSAMFVYALQQGINLDIIGKKDYEKTVQKGYRLICSKAKINKHGLIDIYDACDGLGVQNNYDRYIHYKQMLNAKEAVAGFVWATEIVEREKIKKP